VKKGKTWKKKGEKKKEENCEPSPLTSKKKEDRTEKRALPRLDSEGQKTIHKNKKGRKRKRKEDKRTFLHFNVGRKRGGRVISIRSTYTERRGGGWRKGKDIPSPHHAFFT